MQLAHLVFIGLLCFITTLMAATDREVSSDHLQRLAKRGCDFACKKQSECDDQCYALDYGTFLLGVCHGGKCFCGFMPQ